MGVSPWNAAPPRRLSPNGATRNQTPGIPVALSGLNGLMNANHGLTPVASAPVKAIELSGESPDQSIRYRSVAEGNCVFNRKGGKQPEANEQSVTQVNSIRPSLSGSELANREPLTSRVNPDEAQLRVAE